MNLVSIVIPTYKRSDTLPRAIRSVLNQSYQSFEILVVDDNGKGSEYSEEVQTIVGCFGDSRVKYISQEKHINGAEARNEGIRRSKGQYIAFLDDDDEWLPNKIEKQVEILNLHDEYGGVSCLYDEYNNGQVFHSCPPYTGDDLHRKIFQRSVAVFTSTVMLRKDALIDAGIFNNTLHRHQDLQLLLDFTSKYKIYVLNEYLVKLHSDSIINRPSYVKLKEIKEDFFCAVQNHLSLYSNHDQKLIISAHIFELAFSAIKEGKYWCAIKEIIRIGVNKEAYKLLRQRIKNRSYLAKESSK